MIVFIIFSENQLITDAEVKQRKLMRIYIYIFLQKFDF